MIKFIYSLILFIPLVLFSCSSDNNEDMGGKTTYKVRYEATCDNPNILLRIVYNTKNTDIANVNSAIKEVFVKAPFSVELKMKKGEYCYISVNAEADEDTEVIPDDIIFTSSIYVDDVKKKEISNKTASISDYLLGN
jgi:hypothetical protein